MMAAALLAAFLCGRGNVNSKTRWYHARDGCMLVARLVAGDRLRVVTESGRQPWIGLSTSAHAPTATSPVPGRAIAGTLVLFVLAYGVVVLVGHLLQSTGLIRAGAAATRRRKTPGIFHAARFRRRTAEDRIMEWYLPPIMGRRHRATAVAMYVVLDGFDLGIGILFPFTRSESERDQMMRSIAPFWDGNETWLVLGGAGLFVAFPRAYAVVNAGVLSAGDRHATGASVSRHRVRFRTVSRQQERVERRLHHRLDARGLYAGP